MSFFFFKQKTAYEIPLCDWSSDVCSSDLVPGPLQRRRRRHREFQREAAGADIAPELLAEQGFDIGLVVDDENINAQFRLRYQVFAAIARGSVNMNSVNT